MRLSNLSSCTFPITAILALLGAEVFAEDTLPTHAGWVEAVAIVRDLDATRSFFQSVGDYEIQSSSAVPKRILKRWDLTPSVSGKQALLAERGSNRGYIRLVELTGESGQIEARSAAQFFDTGGIMGLNFRVTDIDQAFANVQARGWRPLSQPVRFSVEEFSVAEAIFLGPDGLVVGLIERERPPLTAEWSMTPGKLSRPNNVFLSSASLEASVTYYEQELGWRVFLRDQGPAAKAGMNLYGWPHNWVANVSRDVAWLHPGKGGEGSIAIIELDGVEGSDYSATAKPPNLGWIALRTWSPDDSVADDASNTEKFVLAPYGCVTLNVTTDPDGVRLEHLRAARGCEAHQ